MNRTRRLFMRKPAKTRPVKAKRFSSAGRFALVAYVALAVGIGAAIWAITNKKSPGGKLEVYVPRPAGTVTFNWRI